MINCVTGRAGEDHITGDDWGHLNAGIVGTGSYVLKTGNQLKATVASANSITISDGDAVIHGRHIRISSPESVTIQSGTVGQRRNDIIVLRYTRTGTGSSMRERGTLVAVRGTSTTGTPKDPSLGTGNILSGSATADMPLYRVPIDGVTVGTPEALFNILTPASEVWDSLSRAPETVQIKGAAGLQGGTATIWPGLGLMSLQQSIGSFQIDTKSSRCTVGSFQCPGTPPVVGTANSVCPVICEDDTSSPAMRSMVYLYLDFSATGTVTMWCYPVLWKGIAQSTRVSLHVLSTAFAIPR